jgi:hypothetical protein
VPIVGKCNIDLFNFCHYQVRNFQILRKLLKSSKARVKKIHYESNSV